MKSIRKKQLPITEHNLKIGKFTIYPNILVCEFNEGVHVEFDTITLPLQIVQLAFGSEIPVIYISNRTNSYSFDPFAYRELNEMFPNFKAFGIVEPSKKKPIVVKLERFFIKKPISAFDNLEAAIQWAEEVLENVN